MRKVYEKINNMRGNLITVTAEGVALGELARIEQKNGRSLLAQVLKVDGDQVTLQVFKSSRGISTEDRVVFLAKEMQATFTHALLGRRLNGVGEPIDGGPEVLGEEVALGSASFNPI